MMKLKNNFILGDRANAMFYKNEDMKIMHITTAFKKSMMMLNHQHVNMQLFSTKTFVLSHNIYKINKLTYPSFSSSFYHDRHQAVFAVPVLAFCDCAYIEQFPLKSCAPYPHSQNLLWSFLGTFAPNEQ